MAGVAYKRFDDSTVAELWFELLTACRHAGWRGGVNGRRGGSRTYAMQFALYQLWRSGRGAPAFAPNGPSRHMRRNIGRIGPWAQAVDVTFPEDLIRIARTFGVELHQPYLPREPWHVEARQVFALAFAQTRRRAGPARTGGAPVKSAQLTSVLTQAGVAYPEATVAEARRAGLPLAVACALLEQESGGGHNVFGHDPVKNPIRGGPVTKERYLEYVRYRKAGLGMQGVGPCQLTWYSYQDRADALGGCWKPEVNMRVGFALIAALIKTNGLRAGLRRYNGAGPAAERYADQVLARVRKWQQILGAVPGTPQPPTGPPAPPTTRPTTPATPPASQPASPRGPFASDFVALCLRQRGDRYVFGAEAKFDDPDPDVFDCSELIEWALRRMGIAFPDGSWAQEAACRSAGKLIAVDRAVRIQGALLFRHRGGNDGHVAVSLGNGSTIEARGRDYGVNVFSAAGRVWTAAGLVPGLNYARTPHPPTSFDRVPAWPGRYLAQPPLMRGSDVRQWQQQMQAQGYEVEVDGVYGANSERECRRLQKKARLVVDGVVGPDTWRAAWVVPGRARARAGGGATVNRPV